MSDDRTASMSWYGQNWYPHQPPIDVNVVSTPVSIAGLSVEREDLLKRIAELELRVRRIEDVQRLGKRR